MSLSQKDAVVNEVKKFLGSSFDSSTPAKELLTEKQLKDIKTNIFNGILDGSIEFGKEITNEKEVSSYVSGMVSNYLRKSKELNGGETYVAQSTGRGSRDAQTAELNKLLKSYKEGTEEYSQILLAIEARKATIIAEKAPVAKEKKIKEFASINLDSLPENLRHFASQLSK